MERAKNAIADEHTPAQQRRNETGRLLRGCWRYLLERPCPFLATLPLTVAFLAADVWSSSRFCSSATPHPAWRGVLPRQHEGRRSLPLPSAICSIVRPEATDLSLRIAASPSSRRPLVLVLDQQPVVALAAAVAVVLQPHQHPAALQLVTGQDELQLALAQRRVDVVGAFGQPEAAVPQHHRAAAILALGIVPSKSP